MCVVLCVGLCLLCLVCVVVVCWFVGCCGVVLWFVCVVCVACVVGVGVLFGVSALRCCAWRCFDVLLRLLCCVCCG